MAKKNLGLNSSQGKIIGRVREQGILRELTESKKSEFIAIYGRRRVGKTYLIKNLMDSLPCLFFHVTGLQNSTLKEQLEEFAKQIGITFYQGAPITP
jgi:AAA+ ATPase superfamily predicted ATPase